MNICITVNSKYMRYLYIMLVSLLENNEEKCTIYILHNDFTVEDKKAICDLVEGYGSKVVYIWIDKNKFKNMPKALTQSSTLSIEIYFRLIIPEALPKEIDRILMLDVDIIVNQSIKELYDLDFKEKYLAAALNMGYNFIVNPSWRKYYPKRRKNWGHYNTGILLWNLKKIREELPKEYIYQLAWKYPVNVPTFEEEIFNMEFGEDQIHTISAEKWNYITTRDDFFEEPRFKPLNYEQMKKQCHIIHYAAQNPWNAGAKKESFRIWWEYAKKTPYYLPILEECYQTSENFIKELLQQCKSEHRKILNLEDQIKNGHRKHVCLEEQIRIEQTKLSLMERLVEDDRRSMFIQYLKNSGVKNIAVYGAGRVAKGIRNVLMDSDIAINYYIDQERADTFFGAKIYKPEELKNRLEKVDLIIISVSYYMEDAKKILEQYIDVQIKGIDEILRESIL